MARIYLDARAASRVTSGVGRYCHGLIPELAAQAPQHEFIIIGPPAVAPLAASANARHVAAGGTGGTLPLLMSAPQLRRLFSRWGPADLYHALFHLVPFGIRRGEAAPKRVVVTLHDLIWIDFARQVETTVALAAWRRRLASVAIPYALGAAHHVICNSEATAKSAERWTSPDRRSVIHLGVGDDFFESDGEPAGDDLRLVPHPAYIAAFGVAKAYKNIGCLVRAFAQVRTARPELRLVLIGGDGGVTHDIEREGVAHAVDIIRPMTDREMRALIRRAKVFVVPSIVEGFGLPAVEAMALGTPVVVSNAPALLEVAGDAALRFDASDPSQLAAVLNGLLADGDLQRKMAALGRLRAASFRWPRAASQTLAVYEHVLSLNGVTPRTDAPC